jgi:hypothetical protein
MLLATALLAFCPALSAPAPTDLGSAARAEAPKASSVLAEWAGTERTSSLGQRIQAIRQRVADRRASEIELARQLRRSQELRPFSPEVLGSHARRARLGQRTLASVNDVRLGSLARRQLYSQPGRAPQKPRPRR